MAEQDSQKAETEITDEPGAGSEQPKADEAAMSGEDTAAPDAGSEESPEGDLESLQADLAAARDAALRAQADAQNIQRRAEQDVERARKYALERFTGDLLPVVDNLERALEAVASDTETPKPVTDGVELTLKSLVDVLAKQGVEQVNPEGEPFDPNLHQAMSMVENKEVEPNTVIAVMQKGYTLNGRLIRPAMVMVSK